MNYHLSDVKFVIKIVFVFIVFINNQLQIRRRRFTTVKQLKRAIITEWGKLSPCFIDRAINEWRHRLECVVQQQGGHTQQCFWMNLYVCLTLFIYLFAEISRTYISLCSFWGHPVNNDFCTA